MIQLQNKPPFFGGFMPPVFGMFWWHWGRLFLGLAYHTTPFRIVAGFYGLFFWKMDLPLTCDGRCSVPVHGTVNCLQFMFLGSHRCPFSQLMGFKNIVNCFCVLRSVVGVCFRLMAWGGGFGWLRGIGKAEGAFQIRALWWNHQKSASGKQLHRIKYDQSQSREERSVSTGRIIN